jgi:hypothetical protein
VVSVEKCLVLDVIVSVMHNSDFMHTVCLLVTGSLLFDDSHLISNCHQAQSFMCEQYSRDTVRGLHSVVGLMCVNCVESVVLCCCLLDENYSNFYNDILLFTRIFLRDFEICLMFTKVTSLVLLFKRLW